MSERFHVDTSSLRSGDIITLGREESHHLLKVMRARPGQVIRIFGSGHEHEALLVESRDGIAFVEVRNETRAVSPPSVRLTFAIPWLKGGRTEHVVQKLTELGAAGITIYAARREVAHGGDTKLARLSKIALESCKQCGRSDVPGLLHCGNLADAIAAGEVPPAHCLLLYENENACLLSAAVRRMLAEFERGREVERRTFLVASGPEGGLPAGEIAQVRAHATMVSLGPRVLRAETAPVAACAAILALCGDL